MSETKFEDFQIPEGWALERVKPLSPNVLRIFLRKLGPLDKSLSVKVIGDR